MGMIIFRTYRHTKLDLLDDGVVKLLQYSIRLYPYNAWGYRLSVTWLFEYEFVSCCHKLAVCIFVTTTKFKAI